MGKNLYLHIGSPKTGSTAIEAFLGKNRERLISGHRMHYVRVEEPPESDAIWSHGVIVRATNPETILGLIAEECARHLECDVILSSQSLSLLSTWNDTFRSRCDRRLLATLADAFPNHTIKVVYYVRRLDDFAKALYNTYIGHGQQRYPFRLPVNYPDFLEVLMDPEEPFGLHPHRFIEEMIDQLGEENVILRLYDRQTFKNNDVIDDFLDAVGLNPADFPDRAETDPNPRIPDRALPYLSCLYESAPTLDRSFMKMLRDDIVEAFSEEDEKAVARAEEESAREIEKIDARLPGYKALFEERKCSFTFPETALDPHDRIFCKLLLAAAHGDRGRARAGTPPSGKHAVFLHGVQDVEVAAAGELLKNLGYADCDSVATDYGFHTRPPDGKPWERCGRFHDLPYTLQAAEVRPGHFLPGHVGADALRRAIDAGGRGLLILRDLRETVLAEMYQRNREFEVEESRLPYDTYNICIFLLSHYGYVLGACARECVKLLGDVPLIRFDDMFSATPARTRSVVDTLVLAVGTTRTRAEEALCSVVASPWANLVQEIPRAEEYWNDRVEEVFRDLGLDAVNASLGYSPIWPHDKGQT